MANKRKRRPSATPPAEKPTQEQAVSNEGATDQQRMIEKEKDAIIQGESEKTDTAPQDPGKILIRIKDKNVTVLPAEEDPAELAEAAEQLKKAQERLQAAFAPAAEMIRRNQQIRQALVTPAIEEMLRHNRQIQQTVSPAFELFLQTQYQRNSAIEEYGKIIAAAMRSPAMEAMQNMVITMQTNLERVTRTFQSMQDIFDASRWDSTRQMLEEIAATAPALLDLMQEVSELTPYLEAEIQKPEYEGKTLDDLLSEADPADTGEPADDSLFMQALAAARAARDADAAKEEIPRAAITRAQSVEYPLDKPNSKIWNLLEKDTKGQVAFNMAKHGSRQTFLAYYAIDFDALSNDGRITLTKRLLPFDKLVYIAVSALFNAGNNVITLSQIYYTMGYTGRPGLKDLTRINEAITKMTTARIFFDNEQEAEKYKYPRFKYDGSLLPLERGTVIVNGKLADAAIKIYREPPLITFAKQRQQITTIDAKLLRAPISKTDANLQIQDYLLERISKAKNGKGRSCRILFRTLYERTGIPDKPKTNTEKQRKKRAPEKIKKYLTYYQEQEFITRFTTEPDGITVFW